MFLQVQFPLSLASIKYKHFLMFGWGKWQYFCNKKRKDNWKKKKKENEIFCPGLPSLNKVIWVVAQLIYQKYQAEETSIESCPLVQDRETDVILVT